MNLKKYLNERGKKFGVSVADFNDPKQISSLYDIVYPMSGALKEDTNGRQDYQIINNGTKLIVGPVLDPTLFEKALKDNWNVTDEFLVGLLVGFTGTHPICDYAVITEDSHDYNGNVIYNGLGNVSGQDMLTNLYVKANYVFPSGIERKIKIVFATSDIGKGIVDYSLGLAKSGLIDAIFLNVIFSSIPTDGYFTNIIGFAQACKELGVEFWITKLHYQHETPPYDEYDKFLHIVANYPGFTGITFLAENWYRDSFLMNAIEIRER